MTFDEDHHVEITVYLCDGPITWVRPDEIRGKQIIGGLMVNANMFVYREVLEAQMKLATARIIRSLEEAGVLK